MQWIAIDGSYSKSPLGGKNSGPSPVDRRKSGTKKHICVDQNGIVLGISVSKANTHDNKVAQETVNSIPINLKHRHVIFAADKAYDAKQTKHFLLQKGFVPIINQNRRRNKQKLPTIKSRHRWIVERSHAHLNRWRAIFIRWIRKDQNYIAAIQIAAANLTFRFL